MQQRSKKRGDRRKNNSVTGATNWDLKEHRMIGNKWVFISFGLFSSGLLACVTFSPQEYFLVGSTYHVIFQLMYFSLPSSAPRKSPFPFLFYSLIQTINATFYFISVLYVKKTTTKLLRHSAYQLVSDSVSPDLTQEPGMGSSEMGPGRAQFF